MCCNYIFISVGLLLCLLNVNLSQSPQDMNEDSRHCSYKTSSVYRATKYFTRTVNLPIICTIPENIQKIKNMLCGANNTWQLFCISLLLNVFQFTSGLRKKLATYFHYSMPCTSGAQTRRTSSYSEFLSLRVPVFYIDEVFRNCIMKD